MIKKLLSNAMLSIVMDKQAKEKFHAIRQVRKYAQNGDTVEKSAEPRAEETDGQTRPSRQELIAQAMAVHQSQSKILDDLTLNEKQQLLDLAAKALLGRTGDDNDK